MMGKLLVVAGVAGLGYWYWTSYYQQGMDLGSELRENARTMQRCVRQESAVGAGVGMAGFAPDDGGREAVEARCAVKHMLYQRDGQWYAVESQ